MTKPFLSVIIPAFNEAERLPLTLIDIDRHLSEAEYSYEIIVVNDASHDATSEIVGRFIPVVRHLKLIDSPEHRGRGAAVRIGMLSARGNWRLAFPAGNAISIVEFNRMLPALTSERGIDVAVASREAAGSSSEPVQPVHARSLDWAANRMLRVMLSSRIKDFFLGFHCFSSDAAEEVFAVTKLDRARHSAEALSVAEKMGYRVEEVPVSIYTAALRRTTLSAYLQLIGEAVKIRWWQSRGRYYRKPKAPLTV